ncbi:hypothetical protein PRZ48_008805 [Zasmidium cellare]|uniref:Uncharacterized protein n=1 Tax=Zasmidium cellare TaxID=395010 RepID=A0ABR0EHA7_ZASCE|nr:hypothetical protein PRZ48_008805 [Zasmidium cellare]
MSAPNGMPEDGDLQACSKSSYPSVQYFKNSLKQTFGYRQPLHWDTDEDILASTRTVFKSKSDHSIIALCLGRVIHRVNWVPPTAVIVGLAESLSLCIVGAMLERPDSRFINLRDSLSKQELLSEINRIAKVQRNIHRPVDQNYVFTLSQIRRACEVYGLVPAAGPLSQPFETVLDVVARATADTTVVSNEVKKQQARIRQEHLHLYGEYVKASHEAEQWRAAVRGTLREIPAEMLMRVFEALAKLMLPPRLTEVDLPWFSKTLLQPLAKARNNDYSQPNRHIAENRLNPFDPDSLKALTDMFGSTVREMIIKSLPVHHIAQFPTISRPDQLPIPPCLATNHKRHIMTLLFTLTIPKFSGSYYPAAVFNVQDGLPRLLEWAPLLKTFGLNIVNKTEMLKSFIPWTARLPARGLTTAEAEFARVVASMRKVEVDSRSIRYETADVRDGCDREDDSPLDLRKMADQDVADVLTAGMGEWLEI